MIRATAHAALQELREVIGVLRDGRGRRAEPPQPTLARHPGAGRGVAGGRHAGRLPDRAAAGADVPDALGRTAYRIVQEGLTNARKHAPGAAVDVSRRPAADELVVEVVSRRAGRRRGGRRARRPGAGTGLIGLAERVALAGGDARARAGRRRRLRPARDAAAAVIRVLLVDDDALVRSGLRMMLAGAERDRGRGGGRRRPRRARRRRPAPPGRRADGHPHAAARRHRRDAAAARRSPTRPR